MFFSMTDSDSDSSSNGIDSGIRVDSGGIEHKSGYQAANPAHSRPAANDKRPAARTGLHITGKKPGGPQSGDRCHQKAVNSDSLSGIS